MAYAGFPSMQDGGDAELRRLRALVDEGNHIIAEQRVRLDKCERALARIADEARAGAEGRRVIATLLAEIERLAKEVML